MLYQIHRYPAELIDILRLTGGERVLIRPVLPQDAELTTAFFGGLSAAARYGRFMSPMRHLPPDLVRRFTQVDYAANLALVAETFENDQETVIAEARMSRVSEDEAEFAVSVAERWQRRGLASHLLGILARHASREGLRRLTGSALSINHAIQSLARKAGYDVHIDASDRTLVRIEIPLIRPQREAVSHSAATRAA